MLCISCHSRITEPQGWESFRSDISVSVLGSTPLPVHFPARATVGGEAAVMVQEVGCLPPVWENLASGFGLG